MLCICDVSRFLESSDSLDCFKNWQTNNESYWSFSSLGGFTGVHLKYQKQLHSASWFVLARLSGTVSHYWLFWLMGLLLRWRSPPNISLQDSKHYEQETLAGSSRISTTVNQKVQPINSSSFPSWIGRPSHFCMAESLIITWFFSTHRHHWPFLISLFAIFSNMKLPKIWGPPNHPLFFRDFPGDFQPPPALPSIQSVAPVVPGSPGRGHPGDPQRPESKARNGAFSGCENSPPKNAIFS